MHQEINENKHVGKKGSKKCASLHQHQINSLPSMSINPNTKAFQKCYNHPQMDPLHEIDELDSDAKEKFSIITDLKKKLLKSENETNENKIKIIELQQEIDELNIEMKSKKKELSDTHKEVLKLQKMLSEHSVYCASLGATVGNILWKVSRLDTALEIVLQSNRCPVLINFMNDTLIAFLEVFETKIPKPNSHEYQFLLSWCGILTNLSAYGNGRFFLISNSEGRKLLRDLVLSVPKFVLPNGELLKKMVLMILYNIMINKSGLELMQSNDFLSTSISESLSACYSVEILEITLKLLYLLTEYASTDDVPGHITAIVTLDSFKRLTESNNSNLKRLTQKVLKNLTNISSEIELSVFVNNE